MPSETVRGEKRQRANGKREGPALLWRESDKKRKSGPLVRGKEGKREPS